MLGFLPYEPLEGCDRRDSEKRSSKTISNVINPRLFVTMKQIPDLLARKTSRRFRTRLVILLISVITLVSLYVGGILTYLFEEDFINYSYPLEIDNITGLITDIDKFVLLQQQQNLQPVNQESISAAINSIQPKDTNGNRIIPLTQFDGLNFTLDIKPTCRQQWGVGQLNSTLLPSSSQHHLLTVIIVVKSAVNNYARRQAVRDTWYLNSTLDLFSFKTVFMVGKCHEKNTVPHSTVRSNNSLKWSPDDCNKNIRGESEKFGDIVQSSGIDSYYNNTIKTYMTLRWLNHRCPADFTLAIDDDYVFEVDNFINYMYDLASDLATPSSHEATGRVPNPGFANINTLSQDDEELIRRVVGKPGRMKNRRHSASIGTLSVGVDSEQVRDSDKLSKSSALTLETALNSREILKNLIALRQLSKDHLWAGYVRDYCHPLRSVLSKWYISRDEYAFNKYPPFVTGGWVLMSFKTIKYLYYTTYFTRSFKFDDVYLGILAYKLQLNALHSDNFMCSINDYLDANPVRSNSTSCIGVHDIDPKSLVELWKTREE